MDYNHVSQPGITFSLWCAARCCRNEKCFRLEKYFFNRMQEGSCLTDMAGKQKEIVHQSGFRAHGCRVNSIKRCRMVGRPGKAHPQGRKEGAKAL